MRIDRLLPSTQTSSWIGRGDLVVPSRQIGGDPLTDLANLTINTGSWTAGANGISGTIPNQTEAYILTKTPIESGATTHKLTADIMISSTGFVSGTEARWGSGFITSGLPSGYIMGIFRYNLGSHTAALLRDRISWITDTAHGWGHDIWHPLELTWVVSSGSWNLKNDGVSVATGTYNQSASGTIYPCLYSYRNGNDPVLSARKLVYSAS